MNTREAVPVMQQQAANTLPESFKNPVDVMTRALVAKRTSSLSPTSLQLAFIDWFSHLAASPGQQGELAMLAARQASRLIDYMQQAMVATPGCPTQQCVEPPAQDRRFQDPAWRSWPFNLWHQSFLLTQEWWEAATTGVAGVSQHHENVVSFTARQLLDMFSPGNYLWSNPLVVQRTLQSGGMNLLQGMANAADDYRRTINGEGPAGADEFVPGKNVAVTPGKVVYQNRLIELIQYSPAGNAKVCPEPVLIVPAWIMKYYILDLSPHNSLIRYMVEQGHTVFCISWKNPDQNDRDLGMDDYLQLGFHAALNRVNEIVPDQKVHATGYCLGGTLLSIAAAAMSRDGDERLASITLFAAQTDFTEPGELGLFIDESQVSLLEAQMAEAGYLTSGQMSGAFQLLRSSDLLWSRMVGEYMMGERPKMIDLMAWNADATRMPARMHGQYLRSLFLNDDLSEGRYRVAGRPVSIGDISIPMFVVGTFTDHVAPWRSVHKVHYMSPAEITFVLTSGGHNAGIVSEPGRPRRYFQMLTRPQNGRFISPDEWLELAPRSDGSWWPEWSAWLKARSGKPIQAPQMGGEGEVIGDAPGKYVMMK